MYHYRGTFPQLNGGSPVQKFEYQRLDNKRSPDLIRLVKLHPNPFGRPLRLELEEYRLESAPPFRAISYHWGNQAPSTLAFCHDRRIYISKTLDDAFRAILRLHLESRRGPSPLYVWADAVCINQGDEIEKAHQISLMRAIYSRADLTHIWLGFDSIDKELENAFGMIRKYAKKLKELKKGQTEIDLLPRMLDYHLDRHSLFKPDDVRHLWRLLQRKWFQRIWVIQEATYSMNSQFNSVSADDRSLSCQWDNFHNSMLHFASHGLMKIFMTYDDDIAFRLVQSCVFVRAIPGYGAGDLLHLLQEHRQSRATDPRDKIFALLGMVGSVHCHQHSVDVDYSKSSSELYCEVAKEILETRRDLDILSVYRQRPSSQTRIPSWVPNWAQSTPRPLTSMRARSRGYYLWAGFDASRSNRPSFKITGNSLHLSGQIIDHITSIGEEFDPSPCSDMQGDFLNREYATAAAAVQIKILNNWKAISGALSNDFYWTGESMDDAFLRTTIWNHFPKNVNMNNLRATDELTSSLYLKMNDEDKSKWKVALSMPRFAYQFEKHSGGIIQNMRYYACLRRRMFKTSQGYIGLAPALGRKGDLVVIFQGATVPHIIRENKGDYELIGDCYVHGVMEGEVFDLMECERICLS